MKKITLILLIIIFLNNFESILNIAKKLIGISSPSKRYKKSLDNNKQMFELEVSN